MSCSCCREKFVGKDEPPRRPLCLACSRCSGPVHTIEHELLEPWGLKTPCIMAEQQHKDVAIAVLPCPPQGKGSAWHVLWLSFWSPGMRALRRVSSNKDLIALSERQAHVQFIGSLEARNTTDAGMA
jgi:hypothetical protein